MPFWAFLHFYAIFLCHRICGGFLCQYPSGLSFISTRKQKIGKKIRKRCQCPSGLSFISTKIMEIVMTNEWTCVNALLGFPSFLRGDFIGEQTASQCVNALLGFPSFLQEVVEEQPVEQSIFQAFFAGIYLKILKTRFFRLYFVLFTICSYFNTNHSCT